MSREPSAAHLGGMEPSAAPETTEPPETTDLFAALGLSEPEPRSPDNADPHPVTLRIDSRFVDDEGRQYEAHYDVEVAHPPTCPDTVEECPVRDHLEVIGRGEDFLRPWPQPDDLSDEELAALDGEVRHVVVTRHISSWASPDGMEWDVDFGFTWVQGPPLPPQRDTACDTASDTAPSGSETAS